MSPYSKWTTDNEATFSINSDFVRYQPGGAAYMETKGTDTWVEQVADFCSDIADIRRYLALVVRWMVQGYRRLRRLY